MLMHFIAGQASSITAISLTFSVRGEKYLNMKITFSDKSEYYELYEKVEKVKKFCTFQCEKSWW